MIRLFDSSSKTVSLLTLFSSTPYRAWVGGHPARQGHYGEGWRDSPV